MKPMLAALVSDLANITYPVYASPKLDGIRCLVTGGRVLSRSLKPIRNKFVVSELSSLLYLQGTLDGELVIEGETFNNISSSIMSAEGQPNFTYYVFDYVEDANEPFYSRLIKLQKIHHPRVKIVLPQIVSSMSDLSALSDEHVKSGHEGTMVRSLGSIYKYGRSTLNEGYLLKIKPYEDSEAEIVGIVEEFKNTNPTKVNELGLNKRSSALEGKVGKGICGALKVRDIHTGVEFRLSSGLDHELKSLIWNNQSEYINKIVKYKYQKEGMKDKPRIPVFLGFRDKDDL